MTNRGKVTTQDNRMARMFPALPEEMKGYLDQAEKVLKHDRENKPKPKLKCKIFGHKWFSHVLVPAPRTQWRTICERCKINQEYA